MKLTGNILDIKNKRDDRNAGITLAIDKITYITYKKDGKYHQPFDLEVELDTPLLLTGDCLARDTSKHAEEGELYFKVYDKTEEGFELNDKKSLVADIEVDYDEGITLLTYLNYTIVVSNDEFKELKTEQAKARRSKGKR